MTSPIMNISPPTGIVKNINQGKAAQLQFPSFASGPQNARERSAPAKKGDTAKSGDSSIARAPVFALQKDFLL